jgi:hypothetical protein
MGRGDPRLPKETARLLRPARTLPLPSAILGRRMSRENVEIVQRAIDALNRRDLEAVARFSHPEVEMDSSRSRGVQAGIYGGERAA